MRRIAIPTLLVLAAALVLAGPASADVNYKGKTSQGNPFNLRTDDLGVAERASFGWDMNCKGRATLTNGGTAVRFPNATAQGFQQAGRYEASIEKKFLGRFKVRIAGQRTSDTRFAGTLKMRAKVFRKSSGKLLTKCKTGLLRWEAKTQALPPPALPRADAASLDLR